MILWKAVILFENFEFYCLLYILFYKFSYILVLQIFLSRWPKDLFLLDWFVDKPWLELIFKFNQYNIRPSQRALVRFNNC